MLIPDHFLSNFYQPLLSKKSILLLPLVSLAIYSLVLGFAFLVGGWLDFSSSTIAFYVLLHVPFSCTCSVACFTFAFTRQANHFPKLAWFAVILLLLSVFIQFEGMASFVVFAQEDYVFAFSILTTASLCLIAFLVSLFVIIRDAIRRALDFHSMIIFGTQCMWFFFALVSYAINAALLAL